MERVNVKVKRLTNKAVIPKYQSDGAAGFDLHAVLNLVDGHDKLFSDDELLSPISIAPGTQAIVGTGLAFEVPEGYEIQVRSRGSLAFKHSISITNSPGTLDSDYRGELFVVLRNNGDSPFVVQHGDRIAQGVLGKVPIAEFEIVDELEETIRGEGAFGSTGK